MTYYNLEIIQGSSLDIILTATNQNGSPIILSGYNLRGYAKANFSNTGYLLNLNPTIYSAADGQIRVQISGSATASLPVCEIPYDIEGASAGEASVTKFLRGYAQIYPEISNL